MRLVLVRKLYQTSLFCRVALVIVLILYAASLSFGQAVGINEKSEKTADTTERVRILESQVSALLTELERLKLLVESSAARSVKNVTDKDSVTAPADAAAAAAAKTHPGPEAKQQQSQLGIDLGSVRLTPYGTMYLNAFNNSRSVNNQDVPLFATPFGNGGASASVRQTRLGLRFEGPKVGDARLSGVIEADFFGGLPNVSIGENFGVIRIRLANARLDWERTSVTVGQDWMPFAPVNPSSLAAAGIPQLAAAGNNWGRIPQVRIDRKLSADVTFSAAVLAPQTGDYPVASNFLLQPNSGAASHLPFFQSRIAYAGKDWLGTGKPGSAGLSAHYGRSSVTNQPDDVDSYGVALDWNFPLHKRVSVAGEAFFGQNLGGFQAGVFQGINTDFASRQGVAASAAGSRGIGTRGGWAQIGFTPNIFQDRWTIYGSIGVDDPENSDLTSVSRINYRSRNLAFAVNTIFKVTAQFSLGVEFRRFQTSYFTTARRTSEHVNLGATYSF